MSSLENKPLIITQNLEPCLVCNNPTDRNFFQINVCYACAAFYRRSIDIYRTYKCQKILGNCDVTKKFSTKSLCRFCRFKKCVQVGMEIKRAFKKSLPQVIEPSATSRIIDISVVCDEVKNIFLNVHNCSKQDFDHIFNNIVAKAKPNENLSFCKDLDVRAIFMQNNYIQSAKLLSSNKAFASLPLCDKIILHQNFFNIFDIVVRHFHAVQYFGVDESDLREPFDNYQYFDHNKYPHVDQDGILHFFKGLKFTVPFAQKISLLLIEFKKINFTAFEFSYFCQLILWSCYDDPLITPYTRQLAENIINQISDDLHKHYLSQLKLPTYAARQAKIFRLVNLAKEIGRQKYELLAFQRVFYFGMEKFDFCTFSQNLFQYCFDK